MSAPTPNNRGKGKGKAKTKDKGKEKVRETESSPPRRRRPSSHTSVRGHSYPTKYFTTQQIRGKQRRVQNYWALHASAESKEIMPTLVVTGWRQISPIVDYGKVGDDICEVCPTDQIRYLLQLEHPDYPDLELHVGCCHALLLCTDANREDVFCPCENFGEYRSHYLESDGTYPLCRRYQIVTDHARKTTEGYITRKGGFVQANNSQIEYCVSGSGSDDYDDDDAGGAAAAVDEAESDDEPLPLSDWEYLGHTKVPHGTRRVCCEMTPCRGDCTPVMACDSVHAIDHPSGNGRRAVCCRHALLRCSNIAERKTVYCSCKSFQAYWDTYAALDRFNPVEREPHTAAWCRNLSFRVVNHPSGDNSKRRLRSSTQRRSVIDDSLERLRQRKRKRPKPRSPPPPRTIRKPPTPLPSVAELMMAGRHSDDADEGDSDQGPSTLRGPEFGGGDDDDDIGSVFDLDLSEEEAGGGGTKNVERPFKRLRRSPSPQHTPEEPATVQLESPPPPQPSHEEQVRFQLGQLTTQLFEMTRCMREMHEDMEGLRESVRTMEERQARAAIILGAQTPGKVTLEFRNKYGGV